MLSTAQGGGNRVGDDGERAAIGLCGPDCRVSSTGGTETKSSVSPMAARQSATGDSPAVLRQNSAPALFLACGWRSWGRACAWEWLKARRRRLEMPPAMQGWEARANHFQGFGGGRAGGGGRWTPMTGALSCWYPVLCSPAAPRGVRRYLNSPTLGWCVRCELPRHPLGLECSGGGRRRCLRQVSGGKTWMAAADKACNA